MRERILINIACPFATRVSQKEQDKIEIYNLPCLIGGGRLVAGVGW